MMTEWSLRLLSEISWTTVAILKISTFKMCIFSTLKMCIFSKPVPNFQCVWSSIPKHYVFQHLHVCQIMYSIMNICPWSCVPITKCYVLSLVWTCTTRARTRTWWLKRQTRRSWRCNCCSGIVKSAYRSTRTRLLSLLCSQYTDTPCCMP